MPSAAASVDHDAGLVAEEVDQSGGALVGGEGAGDAVGAFVPGRPVAVDALAEVVGVGPVEEDDLARELSRLEKIEEVILGAARLGEDERFLLKGAGLVEVDGAGLLEAILERGEEPLALGVAVNAGGERVELAKFNNLLASLFPLLRAEDGRLLSVRAQSIIVLLGPLFLKLGKKLEVVGELRRDDWADGGLLCCFEFGR